MALVSWTLTVLVAVLLIDGYAFQRSTSMRANNQLARGEKLFVAQCALCHGIGGTGGRGPSLNQPQLRRAADSRALFQIIQNGIDGTEMPGAWQMTDREIGQVVAYVRSLGRTAVVKLPGDPVKGKKYYETTGGARPVTWSLEAGKTGPDLTDIGARRSAAYLREALIDPGAAVPEGFLIVTIVTQDGRKIRGLRSNEDSFTIQLRDEKDVFHSFSKLDLRELKKEFGASVMPGYRDVFSASEVDDLIAYLAGLRGEK